jgi:serine/threonine-protein kinase
LHSLAELVPGKVFHGRYEVVRCIRTGGMGAVYEVVHLETRRRRALKVMLPSVVRDAEMRSRFRVEAQITAEVESDHIVETFDAGVDAETGAPFLVMELLRGEDLAHHLEAHGRMAPAQVVAVLHQLARALEQTHARGIVHRDLKPENLFLAVRGDEPPRLKVLDFGIAKVVAQSAQGAGATTNVGTPLYMSPEQFEGAALSPRTDLFAVGHLAFTLLTGHAYFREEAERIQGLLPLVERLSRRAEEPASARAARRGVELPAAFDAWFAKATARSPDDRFQRAGEQCAALADALGVTLPRTGDAALAGVVIEPGRPSIGDAHPSIAAAPTAPAPWSAETADAASSSVTSVPDASPPARRPARARVVVLAIGAAAILAAAAAGVRFSIGETRAGASADSAAAQGTRELTGREPAAQPAASEPAAREPIAPSRPVVEPASAADGPSAADSPNAPRGPGAATAPAAPSASLKAAPTSSARTPSSKQPAGARSAAPAPRDPSKVFE